MARTPEPGRPGDETPAGRDGGSRHPDRRDAGPDAPRGSEGVVGPDPQVERDAPDEPTSMPRRSWLAVLKRTVKEFTDDELTDRAAALTYYGVLSLFPALLVLVSLLGVAGRSATQQVMDN
ncbi:YhjD/YihY/BrkB family envelope integrity protein, partial [Streptomyces roseolilacinus]|uniref:YhjD/YihY/BrkB family envelope integrity protein n=1 Tax=Streptomyces roseolilacinus TaxID=66904 RepID=UPI00380DC488